MIAAGILKVFTPNFFFFLLVRAFESSKLSLSHHTSAEHPVLEFCSQVFHQARPQRLPGPKENEHKCLSQEHNEVVKVSILESNQESATF